MRYSLDLARILAAYWLFLNLVQGEREAGLVLDLLLLSAALALLSSLGSLGRFRGLSVASLGYGNNVGMYYGMVAATAFALSLTAESVWWRRIWWAATLSLSVGAMAFAALCRSALLAFALFCGLALACSPLRRRGLGLVGLLLAVGVAVVVLPSRGPTELARLGLDTGTLRERWQIWQVAGGLFSQHPWLGIGPGNFKTAARAVLGREARHFFFLGNAHSLYVNTLVERGLVGLALLLAFSAAALRQLRAARNSLRTPTAQAIWWAGLGGIFVILVIGLLDYPLHHEHGLLMATLLALPLALAPRR
jgi:O-antigen ligase